jgi:hypothetical protein
MVSVAILLSTPTMLAFASGGYFVSPRLLAGAAAWALVAASVWLTSGPTPQSSPSRVAIGGLACLTALVGLSIFWAPLRGPVQADLQRLLLYLGTLIAACAFLRGRYGLRLVELALGAGALLVTLYALSARLFPAVVSQTASRSALGRLEQPLTYWNACGMLAACGLILALRVAADQSRQVWLRSVAMGAVVPLGVGAYLTFSRAALLAVAIGAILLVLLSREEGQLRAVVIGIGGAAAASVVAASLPAVRALQGGESEAQLQGLLMTGALVIVIAATIALAHWANVRPSGTERSLSAALAVGLIVVLVVGFGAVAAGGGSASGQPRVGADTRRLTSLESNRYKYWTIAAQMFVRAPLLGEGSSSFDITWRRDRTIADSAHDAHSLYVETAAELGFAGLVALAMFIGGVFAAGRKLLTERRSESAGALAALGAMAVHAGLDWDWEMPALALIAILLAGAVLAADPARGK